MPVKLWTAWTEANMTTLRKMAKQGATAAEIGAEVGKSRDAVISRARRSRITLHRVTNGWEPKPKPVKFVATGPVTTNGAGDVVPGEFVEEPGVTFFDVTLGQCRYPLNDVSPISSFKFCRQPVITGTSWCAEHAKIVFTHHKLSGTRY